MASTTVSSGSHLNRKALKRPDSFMAALTAGFNKISERSSLFVILLAGLFALGLLGAYIASHLDGQSKSAWNAFFMANKTLETELKAIPNEAGKSAAAVPMTFKKLDVDSKLSESVKKFKAVEQDFARTRAAFEARLKLGDLYLNHGEPAKALPWYEKALSSSPGSLEKAMALASVGYAQENLGKSKEALDAFQKAVNLGEESLKGDLLLGMARNYEALHDTANARSTYDKVITDFPGSEYAKTAEIYKAQLK